MIKAEDFLNSRAEFIKYLGFDFVSKKTCVGVIQEFSEMQNEEVIKENNGLIERIKELEDSLYVAKTRLMQISHSGCLSGLKLEILIDEIKDFNNILTKYK